MIDMVPHEIIYFADECTAQMTPDAMRIRLSQSGFPCAASTLDDAKIVLNAGDVTLTLFVEAGFVVEIQAITTFVNDRKTDRLLELIESMGWAREEG